MIPRHQPSFTLLETLRSLYGTRVTISEVENAWENFLQVHSILLPSARAGISWAIKAATDPQTVIVAPAYTCDVVHEAIKLAGRKMNLIDSGQNSFLMEKKALEAVCRENHVLLLCELFGITYDLSEISDSSKSVLRIVDMAMTVPHQGLIERLETNDWAVISFGLGKCLYCGSGGMGFTRNETLAKEIRKIRRNWIKSNNFSETILNITEIIARSLMHTSWFYGLSRNVKDKFNKQKELMKNFDYLYFDGNLINNKYIYLPSKFNLKLIMHIFDNLNKYRTNKILLAKYYYENFAGRKGILQMPVSSEAMSHYIIFVNSAIRDNLRQSLWRSGIDTGVLFPFPKYLYPDSYPRSKIISDEIINLPLPHHLTLEDINNISKKIIASI